MGDEVPQLLRARKYQEALERLLDRYEHKVFRMAVLMLKDRGRAEEVTQDVFLKLWRALPAYDGRAAPGTWLYTIARNTCLSASVPSRIARPRRWTTHPSPRRRAHRRSTSRWTSTCPGFPSRNDR